MTESAVAASQAEVQDHLFRVLVESVRDYAIFMLDPTGHVMTWNLGAERLKGYTAGEIIGKPFTIFYPEEHVSAGKCDHELREAASTGRIEDEGWRVRKDGSRFWANVVITALRDEGGRLLGFAKVTRDMTERRRAEEERIRLAQVEQAARVREEFLAREREARRAAESARNSLAVTLRSIGDGVITTDGTGRITMMNPVAERLTGWTQDEMRGRPLRAAFHIINEGTRRIVESPADRVLREGVVVGLANHTVLISRDGLETPIQDSGAPIRDDAGAIHGVVLVFRDASVEARDTARRVFLAEATSVLVSSMDYRATLARVAEVVVPRFADCCMADVLDEEQREPVCVGVAHADPLKAELVREVRRRYRPGVVQEHAGVMQVLHSGRTVHHGLVSDEMLRAIARDEDHLRMLRELHPTSVVIAPLTTGRRVLGALTLIYSDSGRRYEAGDVGFAEELGRRAGTMIENARLYAFEQRARDMADAASRMKDEFLASVSHELRTPLSAILGWTRLLSRPQMDEAKRTHAIETIERNAHAMTRLIEDLLDVSRIVSGKMRIESTPVDLSTVIHGAIEGVRPAADAKGVRIEERVGPDVPAVQGDATRLQQVVWNLLSNAVKFTPRGGTVSTTLRHRESQVEIVVRDSGVGIAPRFLPHVFEPFRQADAGLNRSSGGLGLGLAIVKRLVELHGGRVDAESDGEALGATFTVKLPVPALLADRSHPMATGPTDHQPAAPTHLGGLHVLVVEDDDDTRELVGEVLVNCGARVTLAASAAAAIDAFVRGVPDVLLSDVGMPGETGLDLIRRIRALGAEAGGNVPAAALSAYTREELRRQVHEAGFELHISKPVDPADLCARVATLAQFRGATAKPS